MSLLDRLVAALYDPVSRGPERRWLGAARRSLLAAARGDVLELGAGTGSNLDVVPDHVSRWIATEPSEPMRRRLVARAGDTARQRGLDVEVVDAAAERLPVPDASVDTVVSTLVLCTVTDLERTLAEVRRVLRGDGVLLLLEHVAADGRAGRAQRVLAPAWRVAGRGCDLHRDTPAGLAAAGFTTDGLLPPDGAPRAALLPLLAGASRPRSPAR
jgi:ubiquinone/menaquinone biosynthesis C-methylase UbiE